MVRAYIPSGEGSTDIRICGTHVIVNKCNNNVVCIPCTNFRSFARLFFFIFALIIPMLPLLDSFLSSNPIYYRYQFYDELQSLYV